MHGLILATIANVVRLYRTAGGQRLQHLHFCTNNNNCLPRVLCRNFRLLRKDEAQILPKQTIECSSLRLVRKQCLPKLIINARALQLQTQLRLQKHANRLAVTKVTSKTTTKKTIRQLLASDKAAIEKNRRQLVVGTQPNVL